MGRRKSAAIVRREILRIYSQALPNLTIEEYTFLFAFHYAIDWLFGHRTSVGAVDALLTWRNRIESGRHPVFNSARRNEFYTESDGERDAMNLFRAMCENDMAQVGPTDLRIERQNQQILDQYFVQHFGEDAEWRGG